MTSTENAQPQPQPSAGWQLGPLEVVRCDVHQEYDPPHLRVDLLVYPVPHLSDPIPSREALGDDLHAALVSWLRPAPTCPDPSRHEAASGRESAPDPDGIQGQSPAVRQLEATRAALRESFGDAYDQSDVLQDLPTVVTRMAPRVRQKLGQAMVAASNDARSALEAAIDGPVDPGMPVVELAHLLARQKDSYRDQARDLAAKVTLLEAAEDADESGYDGPMSPDLPAAHPGHQPAGQLQVPAAIQLDQVRRVLRVKLGASPAELQHPAALVQRLGERMVEAEDDARVQRQKQAFLVEETKRLAEAKQAAEGTLAQVELALRDALGDEFQGRTLIEGIRYLGWLWETEVARREASTVAARTEDDPDRLVTKEEVQNAALTDPLAAELRLAALRAARDIVGDSLVRLTVEEQLDRLEAAYRRVASLLGVDVPAPDQPVDEGQ